MDDSATKPFAPKTPTSLGASPLAPSPSKHFANDPKVVLRSSFERYKYKNNVQGDI